MVECYIHAQSIPVVFHFNLSFVPPDWSRINCLTFFKSSYCCSDYWFCGGRGIFFGKNKSYTECQDVHIISVQHKSDQLFTDLLGHHTESSLLVLESADLPNSVLIQQKWRQLAGYTRGSAVLGLHQHLTCGFGSYLGANY